MIDGHPPRRFAGEPRAARSGGERELAIRGAKREPVPGRRTLSETLAPGGVEIERLFAAQLATAQQQLVPLNDANTAGDHHASNIAACVIRRALHVAGDVVAFARREQHEDTGAMEARLSVIEDECRSALERASTPSSAAIARSVDDTSRQRWDREASAWRVAHGHTEPASTPAADRPRGGLDDRGLGPLGDTHPGPDDEVGHQHGAIPLTNVEQQPSKVPEPIVQVLESAQGTPLPACESWSQRIGVDVGHARLVAGDGASAAARSIGARAFTVGHRVFLGAGNDASTDGGGLLAHELKHVAQQRGASRPGSWHELPFVASSDHRENEARSPDASTGATSEMAIARDDQHASHAASENARTYVGGPYVSQKVRELLERLGIVAHGPFGKYLEGSAFERQFLALMEEQKGLRTFDLKVTNQGTQRVLTGNYPAKLEELVAPESLVTLVNRSRALDWLEDGTGEPVRSDKGPASWTFFEPDIPLANEAERARRGK